MHVNGRVEGARFLPTSYRLAFTSGDIIMSRILVWDFRTSKCLLHYTGASLYPKMSFSSNGQFFACSGPGFDVHLWKESPTGYILHKIFTSTAGHPGQLLSQDGESVVTFHGPTIRLWRTKRFATSPSGIWTRPPQSTGHFVLEFSPDGMLVAVAMLRDNTVTVHNLKSGVPRLVIDTGMEVFGLGVIGNTIVVIGDEKVMTWDIPAGDCVPGARVGAEESSRKINLGVKSPHAVYGAAISPDSRFIALTTFGYLKLYRASTGEYYGERRAAGDAPWFTPDGCDVWCADKSGRARFGTYLEQTVGVEDPPEGYPWGSSRGYRVTSDWWVLGPDRKRLLMLPPPWQSYAVRRVWKGQLLALLHDGLSEPVILEVDP